MVERVPEPGEIMHVQEAWEEPAGGGAVAAVQLARLSGGCLFVTALGDDDRGHAAKRDLEAMADFSSLTEAMENSEVAYHFAETLDSALRAGNARLIGLLAISALNLHHTLEARELATLDMENE